MNDSYLKTPLQPLTERQIRILNFIEDYRQQYEYAPSIREIRNGTGIAATSAVSYHLNRLVVGGYLTRTSEVSRSFILFAIPCG